MKVPLRWLSELVDTGLPTAELTHRLTMAGLEAEKIERIGDTWDNVFVGHVERVERHPNADRLVLAEVAAGEHRLTVVTGAPNIAEGQNVALALAGARLIDGHSETRQLKTLKPGMIRGIRSEGMVCSELELGLSHEHEGIMVLEADAPVGEPLSEWLGDTVIEFEITPNLVHAYSMIGIAREAAALTSTRIQLPPIESSADVATADEKLARIDAPDLCPRCSATVIEGITVGPSPGWLTRRLIAAGIRPINNIVDVTNYVMLEWGQPLHAYDLDRLVGGGIIVRRANADEVLETLDHQRRELTPDMLVIADESGAVGVAGVMGGVDSEIDETTTSILLEAANFDMTSIRQTARHLGLRTDASARFERGLDPNLTLDAASRATRLMLELCPGSRVVGVADAYPVPTTPNVFTIPFGEIERLLGVRYEPDRVVDALTRLDFAPSLTGNQLRVTIPTYRQDVSLAADIVEEVARVIGYDTLPATLPSGQSVPVRRDPIYLLQRSIRSLLVASGCSEAVTYSAVSKDELAAIAGRDGISGFVHTVPTSALLTLANPVHHDRAWLRPTLIPTLLESTASNLKHRRGTCLFELARVYLPTETGGLPHEANIAAIVTAGLREPLNRFQKSSDLDFFDLKGIVETVLARLGLPEAVFSRLDHSALHPGRAAAVHAGERRIGILGELRPDRAAAYGIEEVRVGVAELDLDAILLATAMAEQTVSIPRFLPVEQDFAVIVDEATDAYQVQTVILAGAGPLATDIVLFDIYRGPQIGDRRKSLAYRVTFTAPDRALTDAELTKVRSRIERSLAQRVNGELRG